MSAKIYLLPTCAITTHLERHFLGADRLWHARRVEQEHKNVTNLAEYQNRRLRYVAANINPPPKDAA